MADKLANPYARLDTSLLQMQRRPEETTQTGRRDKAPKRQDVEASKRQDVKVMKHKRLTIYLTADQVVLLKRLEMERLERGEEIDRSGLVREAIDLLGEKASKR